MPTGQNKRWGVLKRTNSSLDHEAHTVRKLSCDVVSNIHPRAQPKKSKINENNLLTPGSRMHTRPQMAGLKQIRKKRFLLGNLPSGLGDFTTICDRFSQPSNRQAESARKSRVGGSACAKGIRLWPGWHGAELSRDRSQVTATLCVRPTRYKARKAVPCGTRSVSCSSLALLWYIHICGGEQSLQPAAKQASKQAKRVGC
jgi:hypothetical protein